MRFRLVRHFTLTSLIFFIAAGSAIGHYYRQMALAHMLQQQESNNANLTKVFANTLWEREFSSLIAESSDKPSTELKKISRIQEIHKEVLALMRGSTTYKIKVYDLKGRTIYSSELAQIGEDKSNNPGFLGALSGATLTELVHKEKFSAFEQVVENRDLIQTYIPQYENGANRPSGVFEIYSDVTPLVAEIRETEIRLALLIAGALGALFTALYLIVRRADSIIKQQANENQLSQQHLAQAEKMASLGQLVAGVSHQLNTPIAFSHNNISLTINALKEFALPLQVASRFLSLVRRLPQNQHQMIVELGTSRRTLEKQSFEPNDIDDLCLMLGDVLVGLEQMKELVDNLRDFTRLDRSKVINTDINEALKTVIYIARSSIPTRIKINELLGDLPKLECNASQLNQVFLNLITNAAQAIPEDGEITVKTSHSAGQVIVEVSDTGQGIPDDVLLHIFETYYTTKPKGVGTGLGLSIARDIVKNHGGNILVKTTLGQGTSFTVTLPVSAPDTVMDI